VLEGVVNTLVVQWSFVALSGDIELGMIRFDGQQCFDFLGGGCSAILCCWVWLVVQ